MIWNGIFGMCGTSFVVILSQISMTFEQVKIPSTNAFSCSFKNRIFKQSEPEGKTLRSQRKNQNQCVHPRKSALSAGKHFFLPQITLIHSENYQLLVQAYLSRQASAWTF